MPCFEKITDRIYRLKVPFESVYTAVFLIKYKSGYMLVDAATTSEDARLILDAVKEAGIDVEQISHILITHAHGDHAGGLRTLCDALPWAFVCAGSDYLRDRLSLERFDLLFDGQEISDGIVALFLSGHSADSYGFFDENSRCLISGDAVQLCGIGRYGTGLYSFDDYLATLKKLAEMDIDILVSSHDYYPHGAIAEGSDVFVYISDSERYARYIMNEVELCIRDSVCDAQVITERIREKNRAYDPRFPSLQTSTVRSYIKTIK